MKATIQVFSKKGYYGPELTVTARNVDAALRKVVAKLDDLPERDEGVEFIDWTEISVKIERNCKTSA